MKIHRAKSWIRASVAFGLLTGGLALGQPQGEVSPAERRSLTESIYLTTMTHMEGDHTDHLNQTEFNLHCEALRFGLALFSEYGAKMTVEAELPFTAGCQRWGTNMLQEVLDAGQGVGTHCDVGFKEELMPLTAFAALLKERKDAVDALVGPANNRHFSGGGGENDYIMAGALAGFEGIGGGVSMRYLSMPLENRPPGYTDSYIRNGHSHELAPSKLRDRLHLHVQTDALDFNADPVGTGLSLIVTNGGLGSVSGLAERAAGEEGGKGTFDELDVAVLVQQIRIARRLKRPGQVAKLNLFVAVSDLHTRNEGAFRDLLSELRKLERLGVIKFATQGEVLDVFQRLNP